MSAITALCVLPFFAIVDPEPCDEPAPVEQRVAQPRPTRAREPVPVTMSAPWDDIAACESDETWDVDAHGHLPAEHDARFYGGLQFNKMSWDWAVEVGGHDVADWPHHASRVEQIAVAETLLEIHPAGIGAWPACADALGLR